MSGADEPGPSADDADTSLLPEATRQAHRAPDVPRAAQQPPAQSHHINAEKTLRSYVVDRGMTRWELWQALSEIASTLQQNGGHAAAASLTLDDVLVSSDETSGVMHYHVCSPPTGDSVAAAAGTSPDLACPTLKAIDFGVLAADLVVYALRWEMTT